MLSSFCGHCLPSCQAEHQAPGLLAFYILGVTWSGIEPRPPAPRADALTTMLRGGGHVQGQRKSEVHRMSPTKLEHLAVKGTLHLILI